MEGVGKLGDGQFHGEEEKKTRKAEMRARLERAHTNYVECVREKRKKKRRTMNVAEE